MITILSRITLTLIAVALAGCAIDVSTRTVFNLGNSERRELENRATTGQEARSAIRLAEYYAYSNYDTQKMLAWLRVATALGNSYAADWLEKETRKAGKRKRESAK